MKEFLIFCFSDLSLPFLFQTTRPPKFPISTNNEAIKFLLANGIVPAEEFILTPEEEKKKILQPPLRSEHQPVEGAGIVAAFPTCLSRPLLLLQLLSKVDKYNKAPNTVLWVGSILNNVYKLKGICFCQLFVFLCSQLFCVYSGAGLVLHT